MHPVEAYLAALRDAHATGQSSDELSYYPALSNLIDAVGRTLPRRVTFVSNIKNRGAGHPDGGLFTPEQLVGIKPADRDGLLLRTKPARGVVEIKGTADNARRVAKGKQVRKYWNLYQQVLVTNYREFVLVSRDPSGAAVVGEVFRLADGADTFWQEVAAHPRAAAQGFGDDLLAYLRRALEQAAPIVDPEDVAVLFAAYARTARERVSGRPLAAMNTIKRALEQALGLSFEGKKGLAFFQSTLVQTLFYGVFSAWVLWARQAASTRQGGQADTAVDPALDAADNGHPPSQVPPFDWRSAAHYLRVPVLRKLFHEVADPGQLQTLGVTETLDWATWALHRVDLAAFAERFNADDAIQYFYEPFLQAFDADLRKELGVWYTPREIVRYQVARVDAALRSELGVREGLADPNVYVLDPCCGTGAYIVEVLELIAQRLAAGGSPALVGAELKAAAMRRVFGFEIMPAPYVVSHLQLGLLLQRHGVPLAEPTAEAPAERAAVYLTNALTGWEPPQGAKQQLLFEEFAAERDAAEKVKRETPILVILGNPPYNGFAGVSPSEEQGLLDAYKRGLRDWGITKHYLDDLYVRFWRLAERRIAERTGRGVVCYISNFSFLADPSSVVMRERLLQGFDRVWVDCLNGDSRETGKKTRDGAKDPSVFSTPQNPQGIRVGTAITLLVRRGQDDRPAAEHPGDGETTAEVSASVDVGADVAVGAPASTGATGAIDVRADGTPRATVQYRDFWGTQKREALLESLTAPGFDASYRTLYPARGSRYLLRPFDVGAGYESWPTAIELASVRPSLGLNDNRGQGTHEMQADAIRARMTTYFDPSATMADVKALHPGLAKKAAGFDPESVRSRLLAESRFHADKVAPFWFRPFDRRWAYLERAGGLWNRVRPDLVDQAWPGNEFLLVRARAPKTGDGTACFYTRHVGDQHVLHKDAYFIPFRLRDAASGSRTRGRTPTGQQETLELELPAAEGASAAAALAARPPERANLSAPARDYLGALGLPDPDTHLATSSLIWLHALAVGHTPRYLRDNADGIKHGWPRIPLPADDGALQTSAAMGRTVATLLDVDSAVQGITAGTIRPLYRAVGEVGRVDGGALNAAAGEFAVKAGWGIVDRFGSTMPGSGETVVRPYTGAESAAIAAEATATGIPAAEVFALLGGQTVDVYFNKRGYWRNVPQRVWEYTIGGFAVLRKWLSYREHKAIGRDLTVQELVEFTMIVRRLTALLLMGPELDRAYAAVLRQVYTWPAAGLAGGLVAIADSDAEDEFASDAEFELPASTRLVRAAAPHGAGAQAAKGGTRARKAKATRSTHAAATKTSTRASAGSAGTEGTTAPKPRKRRKRL